MLRNLITGLAVIAAGVGVNVLLPLRPELHNAVHLFYVFVVAALVVQLLAARDRARALARTDALTGVPNRRTFVEVAEARIKRMYRDDAACTLVYLDIDGFKKVNDRFGHVRGDAVLRGVAATLSRQVRGSDTVARLGGDEFVVLLDGEQPAAALERLRTSLRDEAAAQGWPVGFSVGAVTFRRPPSSVEEMLQRTDAAMYTAKGRQQGVVLLVA